MVTQKSNLCKDKHPDKNKSNKNEYKKYALKLSDNSELNKKQLDKGWLPDDLELIGWFYGYLRKHPGTDSNPMYMVMKNKIRSACKSTYGSVRLELTRVRELVEADI